ncbi:hypothetical protein SDC9_151491 [bioreactor metagenome]|uniref:Uncharacterized protein n=1 Tax=bioreactor metagenome TaxID=1076179 RepID=A0A645EQF8_9ZZZZ
MKYSKKLIFYIVILFISGVIYFYPREISKDFNGIMYRLGYTNYLENVKVSIQGNISKGLLKGDKFEGAIQIGDKKLTKISMRFDDFGRGNLFYYDESVGDYKSYGDLISNNMKDQFTIIVLEENEEKSGSSSWSSKDGLMISVLASSRNEALDISNKLMKDILVNELK